jgi:hypothetical protein
VVADTLSRWDAEEWSELMVLSVPSFRPFDDIHAEVATDPKLQAAVAFGTCKDD